VTTDGKKVSSHFGMAPHYRIFTIVGEEIVQDELIDKPHHKDHRHRNARDHKDHQHQDDDHHKHHHGGMQFFKAIEGCQVLVVGGIGEPAYKRAQDFGFEIILTGGMVQDAVDAYIKGELKSDIRRIHRH